MKIAFIGTGKMGAGMVRNLVAAGHQVTAYNRTRERAEGLGAAVADSPAEACRGCDAAMTMLPDDRAVEEAVFGPDGIGDAPHIGSSTISTALARRLAARPCGICERVRVRAAGSGRGEEADRGGGRARGADRAISAAVRCGGPADLDRGRRAVAGQRRSRCAAIS